LGYANLYEVDRGISELPEMLTGVLVLTLLCETFAEEFILTPISLQEVAAYCPLLIDDVKENLHLLSKDDEEFIRNSVLDVISKNPGSSSYAHAAGSEVSRYV
jgi:hypothetical protein